MKRHISVHTGEIMAGGEDSILDSDTNKACLVFAAYDSTHKIGGLAHAMFFSNGTVRKKDFTMTRDPSGAIDEMVEDMVLMGAEKKDIEVCLVTGENVPHEKGDPEYNRHIDEAIELLKEKNIRFNETTVRDVGDMHVSLDVETGELSYK